MPVVLTTAEGKHRAGYRYDDRTGISYEFPSGRYENWIVPGESFVYHQPGKGYTGTGVVGTILPSAQPGRLVCEILDYQPFIAPVPLRDRSGNHYEADPNIWSKGNVFWAQGVRRLAQDRLEKIITEGRALTLPGDADTTRNARRAVGNKWIAIDEYAMATALAVLASRYPKLDVARMPHNNPGYDIRVGPILDPVRYVEVKGTQASDPVFFLSEGERSFSARHSAKFTLLVVVGIDLELQTHAAVSLNDGEVSVSEAHLEPVQWRGYLELNESAARRRSAFAQT